MKATPALGDALTRVSRRLELAGGDLVVAFDRLGVGIQGRALSRFVRNVSDQPVAAVVFTAVLACVEADRAQQAMLARHARVYAEADRRWGRDLHSGQLALDGIEPARHVRGESVTHRQRLRLGLWVRANGACEDCGRSGEGVALDLHHLDYSRYGHEEPSDVTLICRDCHERRHGRLIPAV